MYLKGILDNSDSVTGTVEEMASSLQRKFEALVADDNDIYEKACKGRYYRVILLFYFYSSGDGFQ